MKWIINTYVLVLHQWWKTIEYFILAKSLNNKHVAQAYGSFASSVVPSLLL